MRLVRVMAASRESGVGRFGVGGGVGSVVSKAESTIENGVDGVWSPEFFSSATRLVYSKSCNRRSSSSRNMAKLPVLRIFET